ncbi:MAG: peptidoglycan-binding protein, partial [Candidatus Pacearchaeota archaeon]
MFFFFKKSKIPKEWLGCKIEPPDARDYKLREVFKSLPLFDWQKGYDIEEEIGIKIPVKNQGQSSSCVGQSWSYYSGILEHIETNFYRDHSARFIYSQIYLQEGGAYLRDGGQILIKQGSVPSVLMPDYKTETEMRKNNDLTKDLVGVARVYLKGAYLDISNFYDINSFASIIAMNKGMVSGVFDSFDNTWRTAYPKPSGEKRMGHALYFGKAKMINGKKYLGVLNSWGEEVGDKGWQWLGEEWFITGKIMFPKTIIDLPSEIERPKEKPKHYFGNDLFYGTKNKEVEILQKCLAYEGLFLYPTFTDYFGGYTLRAVKAFQAKYGLAINGFVNSETRKKLNEIFS